MPFHLVASSAGWTLLFRDHAEARDLWVRLVAVTPGLIALCLMPDHLHLYTRHDVSASLRRALGHYTQWRNLRRGERGRVFDPVPPAVAVEEGAKGRRTERYVVLNPCRARLTASPLAWPWSSYRDAVGLALAPVRRAAPHPGQLHAYVARDDTVDVHPLPTSASVDLSGAQGLPALWAAVSALARVPDLRRRCPERALFLHAARALTPRSCREIAAFAGVDRRTVQRAPAVLGPQVRLVERVAGDPRFASLEHLDVAALERWLARKRAWARSRSRSNVAP